MVRLHYKSKFAEQRTINSRAAIFHSTQTKHDVKRHNQKLAENSRKVLGDKAKVRDTRSDTLP